jgi:hypothetical protein
VAGVGEHVGAGGAAAPAHRGRQRLTGAHEPGVLEGVEVPADGGWSQAERAGDLRGGHGAVLEHGPRDAIAGLGGRVLQLHNAIVT